VEGGARNRTKTGDGRRIQPNKIMTTSAKDLTKEPPRSPRVKIGGYDILGRTIDKGRAMLAGTIGEFHFDCPLDNMLFGFKGVKGDEVKKLLEDGKSDDEIAAWLTAHGEKKTDAEIKAWDEQMEAASLYNDPEKKEWFSEQCQKLNLDPTKTTLFEWLEADDKASYG
jgi:hypothetical protein